MIDAQTLLRAYDQQLRTDAETQNALSVTRLGPLRLVTFDGGQGFVTYPHPDDAESIMIGEAKMLDVNVQLPAGVTLRCVTEEADIRRMTAMESLVFGRPLDDMADALLCRLAHKDGMQLWVAETEGQIVSAGRLEPVAGTNFAGIWG